MKRVLNYDQIVQSLIEQSHLDLNEPIQLNYAYKLLNQMAQQNEHQEFSYEVAVELFDRLNQYNTIVTIEGLAQVINEATEVMIAKFDYAMKRELYFEEQKAYLKLLKPYGHDTHIQVSTLKIQNYQLQRPYIVLHIGDFINETEIQTQKNGWFEWQLNVNIPVHSLISDFKIELLENQTIIATLSIPAEALPTNEMKEAELHMNSQFENQVTLLQLKCQIIMGNNCHELVDEKIRHLEEQSILCREEIFLIQQKYSELNKPFLKIIDTQPKYFMSSYQSNTNYEIFANIPDKNSLQPPSLQATAFRNTSSILKKVIPQEQQKLRSYPILARIDILATIIAITSMIINFFTPDIGVTFIMIMIFAIMLKHKYVLYYLIVAIIFGLMGQIYQLSVHKNIFAILLIVLNMLLESVLLILTVLLINNTENMQLLKTRLLLIF